MKENINETFLYLAMAAHAVCASCTKEKQELRVLHLNIWMEGTVVKNGFEAVADEVARIDPDIVMFSEASNKEGALFVPRMLDALRERGKIYYGQGSSPDVALLVNTPYWNKRKTFRIKTGY